MDSTQIVVAWLIGAGIVGSIASNRGLSFAAYFGLSLLLSPLIGLVIVLLSGDGQLRSQCWQCKEKVVVGASRCPHCGAELTWPTLPSVTR